MDAFMLNRAAPNAVSESWQCWAISLIKNGNTCRSAGDYERIETVHTRTSLPMECDVSPTTPSSRHLTAVAHEPRLVIEQARRPASPQLASQRRPARLSVFPVHPLKACLPALPSQNTRDLYSLSVAAQSRETCQVSTFEQKGGTLDAILRK
jgi:hypothetical protein